jgi:hypothetical protein
LRFCLCANSPGLWRYSNVVTGTRAVHALGGAIAVSIQDVGPNLKAAAERDRVSFHIL